MKNNFVEAKGNVVAKPVVRMTQNGTKVATFTIAVNRPNPKNKDEKLTDFIDFVAWGDSADVCEKHLDKGTYAYANGRLNKRNYDDKDGKKVYVTEVFMEEIWLAPPKEQKEENGSIFDDSELPF